MACSILDEGIQVVLVLDVEPPILKIPPIHED